MNWKRIVIGGVVSAAALFVMEAIAGMLGTAKIYEAMMQRLHLTMPMDAKAFAFDGFVSLLFGLLLAWVYAAMRPRYGAGAKTALRAALAVWLPLHVVGTGYQVELGMTTLREGAILSGAALIMVCVAALIAGWIYRERSASSRAAGA